MLALAEAIGLPFETKHLEYNRLRHLGPRILGRSLLSLTTRSRRHVLGELPPHLTISAGHRSVAVVRALRHRSGGRMRSIHVGFPRISPRHFDLVVATPQYPIADDPKLLRVPYALTRTATSEVEPSDRANLEALPQPRQLLIVGGPTFFWNLDEGLLLSTLSEMLREAESVGSVLVTTSPRTPQSVRASILKALESSSARSLLASPGKTPRYPALLEAADSIRITADSVAMTSDAIWSGKPMALVPVTKSWLGAMGMALMDWMGRRLYPQDLRYFWRAIAQLGIAEHLTTPRTSTSAEMRAILGRVKPILEELG